MSAQNDYAHLEIEYTFDRSISNLVPKLIIKIVSTNDKPISLDYFDNPICFIQEYFQIQFQESPIPMPSIKSCSDDKDQKSNHDRQQIELVVEFRDLFDSATQWPKGHYLVDLFWKKYHRPSKVTQGMVKWTLAEELTEVVLNVGESKQFPDGSEIRLVAHGHKEVMSAEDESPLILYLDYKNPNTSSFRESNINIYTHLTSTFVLEGKYYFTLADYAYGNWIKIKYFGDPRSPR